MTSVDGSGEAMRSVSTSTDEVTDTRLLTVREQVILHSKPPFARR